MKTSELPNRSTYQKIKSTIIGFHPGIQHVIYSPSQYPKTFALHPLWSPFPILRKKRWSTSLRFHHPSVNRTMNQGKLYPLRPSNQPTNLDSQNSQKHRPKSGSGSFEAEWKAIGFSERDTISATNPQPANERLTPLVPGYESDINRGQALQDCSNSFRPVINL